MSLQILHISNAFSQSALYKNLIISLDSLGLKQTVYSATRTQKEADYNPSKLSHLDIHTRHLLQPYDRLFFRNKIRKISKDIFNEIDLSSVDLIHAHTLYSDGATALKIKKKVGIPYIIAIRSTDLNAFQKYRPDLRWRRNKILSEAEKIVFISPVYRNQFVTFLNNSMKNIVESKSTIIPNGVDPLFLNSTSFNEKQDTSTLKLLYVGDFIARKNVVQLIKAIRLLSDRFSVSLTLVGGGGESDMEVKQIINSINYPFINHLGRVSNRERLCKIYSSHDIFAMVSERETFGLVYIEALSQGLPFIFSTGEGINGYFEKEPVAESVDDPHNIKEIANKIETLADRLDKPLRQECIKQARRFDWTKIAKTYKDLYNSFE